MNRCICLIVIKLEPARTHALLFVSLLSSELNPFAFWRSHLRIHPLSLALRYLKGQITMRAAPFKGRPLFESEEAAIVVLYNWTGQQFGHDARAWGEWFRNHRSVYHRNISGGVWARVTKVAVGGWRVRTDCGRVLTARITAKVGTLKRPTLQINDRVKVETSDHNDDVCRIILSASPVIWVGRDES
jgi:translation initiation factor IF-1